MHNFKHKLTLLNVNKIFNFDLSSKDREPYIRALSELTNHNLLPLIASNISFNRNLSINCVTRVKTATI